MIDTDPQGNATSGLGIDKDVEFSVYDVIINDVEIENTLQKTMVKNLDVCPSNINLAGAEVELVSMMSREHRRNINQRNNEEESEKVQIIEEYEERIRNYKKQL